MMLEAAPGQFKGWAVFSFFMGEIATLQDSPNGLKINLSGFL